MLSFGAISEGAISALPDAMRIAFAADATYSATESDDVKLIAGTEEYIMRIADTPSGYVIRGTLDKLPQFDRSIIGGDGFNGLSNAWGSASLINTGLYDGYVSGYAIDGRRALFTAFDPTLPYSNRQIVADLIATSFTVDGQLLTVNFQDKAFKLNVPTQPNVYLGTGEYEGGPELTGKRRNAAFGSPKNITPVLLIAAELVLEVNGGRSVRSITNVCDKMYPLTPTSDYATTALLRAAAIADGSYGTCLAEGRLRPGSAYSQLTCNVEGDNSGGYVNTTGTVIRRIISITGCLSDPDEIDTVAFANLETDQPAPIDDYHDENSTETVADTFARLIKGIRGVCGFTRLGLLQAFVFRPPVGTPAAEYTERHIIGDISVESLPSTFDPPPSRKRVSYERNWTIINDAVAGATIADAARAAWAMMPYKVASTSDATAAEIQADHLQAQDPPVRETCFALEVDALADANEDLDFANSEYRLYRMVLKAHPFTHDICQTIRVTDSFARLGFGAGKLGRLAAISDIPDNNTIEVRMVA